MKVRLLVLAGAVALTTISSAQAEVVQRVLDVSLSSGSLAGTEFTVCLSYEDSDLIGEGQEYLPLLSFDFALGDAFFTRDDIFQGGQAIFQDGVLQNVTAAFFPQISGIPPDAPVNSIVFGFGTDGGVAYSDLDAEYGDGSFSFEDPAPSE